MTADIQTLASDLARFAIEAPRYTSYPTAVEFSPALGPDEHAARLRRADAAGPDAPLSIYVHLPFCREMCDFCGCHALVARSPGRIVRYLDDLATEIALVAGHLPTRRRVSEVHLGGGSPSLLEPSETERLFGVLRSRFRVDGDAEISVEVDPRTVTRDKLATYRACGVRRISMGFQDLDAGVQAAIGRNQSAEVSESVFRDARAAGFDGINVDLCYGLPRQTEATFDATLRAVAALRPDRIAVFGYAHVPWLKPLQRRIDETSLPATDLRLRLLATARARLAEAGYRAIGIDHFALPGDPLCRALDDKRLHRNFQGYTTTSARDLIGLGLSAISDVGGAFVQNQRHLGPYHAALEAGRLPAERGIDRTPDDELRGHVIRRLMCDFELDVPEVEARFRIGFWSTFAAERPELERLAREGLVRLAADRVELTPLGCVFVRNVATVFDAHRRRGRGPAATTPRFSKTV